MAMAPGRSWRRAVPGSDPERHTLGRSCVRATVAVTRWTRLGLVLLAVGLLAAGSGAATHLHEQQCRTVQFLQVTAVENGASPVGTAVDGTAAAATPEDGAAVPFERLSPAERSVFRSALAADGPVLVRRGALDADVVRYEGDRYRVRTAADTGCAPWHPRRVVAPLAGGLGLVALGAALTRGRSPGA